ncbi:MAG: baseplate J/gp47 family protein [Clostridium sp.]
MAETKEIIMSRIMSNISDLYDKSEGSFFFDTEMPIAIELANADIKADKILDNGFADTAKSPYLDRICSEQGIIRKEATKSTGIVTITGIVGAAIKKGQLVASDSINFTLLVDGVIPGTGSITVSIECCEFGTKGNVPVGAIKYFPKTIEGLQSVNNDLALNNGYDAETDESLKERYYSKVRTPATSGNKWHYLNWSKEVTGVGDARVIPLWNGNGTVKVIIINSNKKGADSTLINAVSTHIDDVRPIGATVSVVSATEKPITITVTVTIDTANYSQAQVKASIESNISEYLKSIAFSETYVSYARIGGIILATKGVLDYSNLRVNTGTANISILDTEVAILGGVTIG